MLRRTNVMSHPSYIKLAFPPKWLKTKASAVHHFQLIHQDFICSHCVTISFDLHPFYISLAHNLIL